MSRYLETTERVYKEAALNPRQGLCCTASATLELPDLVIPAQMKEMNYGCGSTVHPRDLGGNPKVLYVGVGGGMELLQFAYFTRSAGSVLGIDVVPEMLHACSANLEQAAELNSWFDTDFVSLASGNALKIPAADTSIDVAAQNCLFNIFSHDDLDTALSEMYRVLKPAGRLILSDPICDQPIPESLQNNEELRALCLSGALPLEEYLAIITGVGFGTLEIRSRYPYRLLTRNQFDIEENIFLESVEICAFKDPVPADGPCVFTGRTAIYFGDDEYFDDTNGHLLQRNQPLAVCDKTADNLSEMNSEILITPSTFFYGGGGCC